MAIDLPPPPPPPPPPHTPKTAPEKETLSAFLDHYRAIMVRKVAGLSMEDATRSFVPSGTSILSMIRHLWWVEAGWFREIFAGEDIQDPHPWTPQDPDPEFRIQPGETVASIVAEYEAEIERCRAVVARSSLDDLAAKPGERGPYSLRWIMVHMIEETARHAGHADITRELIDGAVGD